MQEGNSSQEMFRLEMIHITHIIREQFTNGNEQHEIKPTKYFNNSQLKGLKNMRRIVHSHSPINKESMRREVPAPLTNEKVTYI